VCICNPGLWSGVEPYGFAMLGIVLYPPCSVPLVPGRALVWLRGLPRGGVSDSGHLELKVVCCILSPSAVMFEVGIIILLFLCDAGIGFVGNDSELSNLNSRS
jgi:hypothetical protein